MTKRAAACRRDGVLEPGADPSRRKRIADGSGTKIVEVNQLMKQFQQMQQMMKMFKGGGAKKMMRQMEAMKGKGGFPGM